MLDVYPELRLVHIAAVITSGSLFLLRGMAILAGAGWASAAPIRYVTYTVDTVLLAAALLLMSVTRQFPFVHAWLTVKVLLVVAYIALGIFAFRKGRTPTTRLVGWIGALAIYGFIVTIARAHDPLGFLSEIVRS
jgi:uncharacterized membrane protein SirB2